MLSWNLSWNQQGIFRDPDTVQTRPGSPTLSVLILVVGEALRMKAGSTAVLSCYNRRIFLHHWNTVTVTLSVIFFITRASRHYSIPEIYRK
jgi:hypothetical protein